ncbi:NAD(P)H-dependent oxidoreductase [Stutzerimonas sp. VN223-3]|uniref:FMN-dependent NADH-azoreductase n=1 Tax=Stutzerimonas sp. VN223-3 TaxID=3384601 RepID=UPI0038B4C5AA
MKKILAIQGSPRGERSHSRRLLDHFLQALAAEQRDSDISRREVGRIVLPPVTEGWVAAAFHDPCERSEAMRADLALSDELVDELLATDRLVIAAPMYNFGVPSGVKAWIDQIVRIGRTFDFTPEDPASQYKPRVLGKRGLIITTRGDRGYGPDGANARLNHADTHLRDVLGLIGITDVEVVAVENDEFGGMAFEASYAMAQRRLAELAMDF